MVSKISRTVPLGRLRLAEVDDVPNIMPLVTKSMALNFRIKDQSVLVNLIEKCVLSICLLDINEKVVGFLAANDYPLLPALLPGAWEDFVWNKFKAIELNSRNTLFLHMLCWHQPYAREAVDTMLKSIFMHDAYIHYIAIMKSLIAHQLLVPGQSRSEASFKRLQTLEKGLPGDQLPSLWVADRKEVSPRLRVRRAVEADNDDIVPIIERHSPRVRELYGDYYVSEIIARPAESKRMVLVCEHKEVAVGVMCLNTQINYEALEESYELSPFAGLRHIEKHPRPPGFDSDTSFFSTYNHDLHPSLSSEAEVLRTDTKSKVTWTFGSEVFKGIEKTDAKSPTTTGYSQLNILSLLDDDEDELQYDIVNIDTDLLRLPRLFAHDDVIKKDGSVPELHPTTQKEESIETIKNFFKDRKKKSAPSTPYKCPEPTRYSGQPNAFLLELFAMHPEYDERYGFDMLEAAYELFPDREYCVLCLPSRQTCFPLLEHFTLVTPFGSRMRFINDTLYVAHVNAIRGNIRVREGEAYDLPHLQDILEHSPRKLDLSILFQTSLHSKSLSSLILLSENQPVGVVILAPLEDGTSIRNEYDLEPEPRRPGTDACILACIVSPIMEPHGRWFLRDIIRQTRYSTLFWICRQFAKGDASPDKNMMSLTSLMLPVRPRRYMPNATGSKDLEKIFRDIATPFALWSLERRLTSIPKVCVNTNIVVIGASRTGLAFIESLLLGPSAEYLTFTNLTLISEFGLPVTDGPRAADTALPKAARYTDRYVKSLPLYYYLDVKCSLMVKINRKNKCIHFQDGGVKYYDELILTCGRQFQHPEYLKESLEIAKNASHLVPLYPGALCDAPGRSHLKLALTNTDTNTYLTRHCLAGYDDKDHFGLHLSCVKHNITNLMEGEDLRIKLKRSTKQRNGKPCTRMLMDNPKYKPDRVPPPPELPKNVFLINSQHEANSCFRKLLMSISDYSNDPMCLCEKNPVVVYGDRIEAYTCMAALLEVGVRPNMIVFVENFSPEDKTALRVNCFNNETVDDRVQNMLKKLGIRTYWESYLDSWSLNNNRVEYLRLMTPLLTKLVPCFALFYFGIKAINLHAFKAINECGLVYDAGVVVGADFDTNDSHVHAAGTCTRYSRRLLARAHHHHYCSEDVGEALGRLFLRKLDPFMYGADADDEHELMQRYSSSLIGLKASSSHGSLYSSTQKSSHTSRSHWQPLMKFESPIVVSATLPGPLYYTLIRKPGPEVPMAVQLLLPHQGHTLITDKRGNYFRLQLNELHRVESICCLSKQQFSSEIFAQVYNKHEMCFNNLLARFQMNLIEDFYEYFTQPWLTAMYQEPFSKPLDLINEQCGRTMYNVVKSKYTQLQEDGLTTTDGKHPTDKTRSEPIQPDLKVCGQREVLRREATKFWKSVGGEDVVMKNFSKYLKKYNVCNPHYAVPEPHEECE